MREDQLTFSIGSSSSLNNNQINLNIATNLPSYNETINKPTQQMQPQPQIITELSNTVQTPPSPPPSFSAIAKENSNLQSRNDNIDSQSNYSSISAAPILMAHSNVNKKIKKLRFNCSKEKPQNCYDSNETFSLNSSYCINNATGCASSIAASGTGVSSSILPSEICTIITNTSLNSAVSNASKFVLRGSFDNNIDQTSLYNYSTSLSDAILHNEGNNYYYLIILWN